MRMDEKRIIPELPPEEALQVKGAAMAAAITGIALSDLQGRIIYVNPAFMRMWRCEEREVLGLPATEFWQYPEDASIVIEHLRTKGDWSGELIARRRDGSLFDVQLTASLVRDTEARPLYMLGIFLDITDRKWLDAALRERIKELHLIYQLSDLAQDPEIGLVQFLQEAANVLPSGLQYPDDACAAVIVRGQVYASPAFQDAPWHLRSSIRVGGMEVGGVVVAYRSPHPPADEGPFLAEERSLLDETSRRIGLFVERKQEQEALRRSEARYRGLFENSPIAIFEQDFSAVKQQIEQWRSEGVTDFRTLFESRPDLVAQCIALVKFLDFGKASLALYGATNEAELRVGLEQLVPPEARHLFVDELVWIAEGRTAFQWEGINRRFTGEPINIRLHWAAEPGYEDTLARVLVSIEDITEVKRMQQEMIRSERLAAMGQVTAILAHEVQNPLQAIQSNLELIADYPLDTDERDECLRISRHEVERLREMTRNVLNMSRINPEAYRPVRLTQVWQQAHALLGLALRNAAVGTVVDLANDLPAVHGSLEQLAQVLINLILNAIESMPNGGEVQIGGAIGDEHLIVTFRNNGPPIPTEHLPRLFEPFFTTKLSGTGLGLFVSHMIVQQHQGELTAANLPGGQGVQFTMALPLASPSTPEPEGVGIPAEAAAP